MLGGGTHLVLFDDFKNFPHPVKYHLEMVLPVESQPAGLFITN